MKNVINRLDQIRGDRQNKFMGTDKMFTGVMVLLDPKPPRVNAMKNVINRLDQIHGDRQKVYRRHEKQGRTPARRLIDSGDLRPEERQKLEHQLSSINPFALRAEIRQLEDQLWSHREELYKAGDHEALALAGAPPPRSEAPARAIKPRTRNQAARVS